MIGVLVRRDLGHEHVQREDHMRVQGEDGHLQATERGDTRRTHPC
jgi:hypothetical protein